MQPLGVGQLGDVASHRSGRTGHEHRRPGREGEGVERVPGGQSVQEEGDRLGGRGVRGSAHGRDGRHDDGLAVAAAGAGEGDECHDPRSDGQVLLPAGRPLADLFDDSADVHPGHVGRGDALVERGEPSAAGHGVDGGHPRGVDADEDLPRSRTGVGQLYFVEDLGASVCVESDGAHGDS